MSTPQASYHQPFRREKNCRPVTTKEKRTPPHAHAELRSSEEGGCGVDEAMKSSSIISKDSEDDDDDDGDDIREVRSMSHAIAEALREHRESLRMRNASQKTSMACVDEGLHEEGSAFSGGLEPSAQKSGYPGTGSIPRTTECLPLSNSTDHATSSLTEGPIGSTTPVRFTSKTRFEPFQRSSFHERFLRASSSPGDRRVLPTLASRQTTPVSAIGQPGCVSREALTLAGSGDHPRSPIRDGSTS